MASSFFDKAPPRAGGVTINDPGEVEARAPGKAIASSSRAGELREPNNRFFSVYRLFNNKLQRYSRLSDSVHGGGKLGIDRSSSSRKALPPSAQLVNNHTGPVGPKHCPGLPDRLCVGATPTVSPQPSSLFLRTNWSDSRGVDKAAQEAGDSTVGTPCGGRILVQHFPSSQKGRRAETSDKSQSPQPARKHRAFQDGGYPHGKGPVEARGLACQGGFEGRLLRNPHTPNPLEVSQISSPRENISLCVPTIRSVISPVGIHQNSEASLSPSARDGHASCGLHRRHFDFGGVQGDGPRSCGSLSVSVGVPGLCNQQREISTCSEPDHRISGPDSQLSQHGASSPASKNENDSGGVPEIVEGTSYLGSHLSPSTGEDECNSVCGSPSSSLLSPPANGAIQCVRGERAELRFSSDFAHDMSRGAELVGHPDVQMEREIDSQDRDRLGYRLRRIPEQLGSPLSPPINRRPMVGRGKKDAHQLPGTSGCHSSSQIICKTQIQNFNSAEDRQHHGSSIHKSPGGYSLTGFSRVDKESMDVVPGEEHPHHSSTPPRVAEHNCRCRVPNVEGQVRLETESGHLSQDRSTLGPTGSGPICFSAIYPVPTLLQLAARSICRSNRCIPPDVDTLEGVCHPTLESCGQDIISDSDTTGGCCTHSSSLEITAVVSNPAIDADRLPSVNNNRQSGDVRSGPICDAPTASRMAYLRERYRGQCLSEEATDLMLKSWRTKTNKSYDSLFTKWELWCSERGSDPISGPVTEVANFLAYLFEGGYQYSSINSYRSAISSVHDRIDGATVGQHPLITRLIKGVFHSRPPLPRYTHTWDVQTVLDFLRSLGDNKELSLKHLSWKVTMLLALSHPSRSADLASLDLSRRVYKPDGVCFYPSALSKQSRQGSQIVHFFFPSLADDP